MYYSKVDICGLDTATLPSLSDDEKRSLLARARDGDSAARELLIDGNLRLVLSIIGRFGARRETSDDLFQVGCIGLIKAVDNFKLELEVKFSTYAVPMIIGELRRYLRDNSSVHVTRSVRDLAYKALQARERLSVTGSEASLCAVASELGEREVDVRHALEAISEPMSLYEPVFSDGGDSIYLMDQLSDEHSSDEVWLEKIALKEALDELGERERSIINMRYYGGKTQLEIASEIGISQAQVSRLEKGAFERIRRRM